MNGKVDLASARAVAKQLIATEIQVDMAIAASAQLIQSTVNTRLENRLSASIGHDAIAKMCRTSSMLVDARAELIDAHASMRIAQTRVGLREVSFGDLDGCPPMDGSAAKREATVMHLTVAA
jgi:hypothetical protein